MSEYTSQSAGKPDRALVAPLGSPERAEALRTGEALLTDDGQVTDTPQAKTIAIGRLARRIQTPTLELVLAAMGRRPGSPGTRSRNYPKHITRYFVSVPAGTMVGLRRIATSWGARGLDRQVRAAGRDTGAGALPVAPQPEDE